MSEGTLGSKALVTLGDRISIVLEIVGLPLAHYMALEFIKGQIAKNFTFF